MLDHILTRPEYFRSFSECQLYIFSSQGQVSSIRIARFNALENKTMSGLDAVIMSLFLALKLNHESPLLKLPMVRNMTFYQRPTHAFLAWSCQYILEKLIYHQKPNYFKFIIQLSLMHIFAEFSCLTCQ